MDEEAIIKIKEGVRITELDLTPQEAFIVSRVDGRTTAKVIIQTSGLKKQEAQKMLEDLVDSGVLKASGVALKKDASTPTFDPFLLDQAPAIEVETKKDILMMFDLVSECDDPHIVLGLEQNATRTEIKRAYFTLSKTFHPDRFRMVNTGPFGERLHVVFTSIARAYQHLLGRDKNQVEIVRAAIPPKGKQQETLQESPPGKKHSKNNPQKNKMIARLLQSKRFIADAQRHWIDDDLLKAKSSFQLALAVDPKNETAKEGLLLANARIETRRAQTLANRAGQEETLGKFKEATLLYVDAAERSLGKDSAKYFNLAAITVVKTGNDLQEAKKLAQLAVENDPKSAEFHVTLGHIYFQAGLLKNALREFEQALNLAPDYHPAKEGLELVKE